MPALFVALRFAPTPTLELPLATLFLAEARLSALVSSLAMFLRFPRLLQVVFNVGTGLSSFKSDAVDREDSEMTEDEAFDAVTLLMLHVTGSWKEDELKCGVGREDGPGIGSSAE